jgi:hypothetical protein
MKTIDPGRDARAERAGKGERELATCHQHHAADQQLLRTEPVHHDADRNLHGRVDEQLHHREGRQLG